MHALRCFVRRNLAPGLERTQLAPSSESHAAASPSPKSGSVCQPSGCCWLGDQGRQREPKGSQAATPFQPFWAPGRPFCFLTASLFSNKDSSVQARLRLCQQQLVELVELVVIKALGLAELEAGVGLLLLHKCLAG